MSAAARAVQRARLGGAVAGPQVAGLARGPAGSCVRAQRDGAGPPAPRQPRLPCAPIEAAAARRGANW